MHIPIQPTLYACNSPADSLIYNIYPSLSSQTSPEQGTFQAHWIRLGGTASKSVADVSKVVPGEMESWAMVKVQVGGDRGASQ